MAKTAMACVCPTCGYHFVSPDDDAEHLALHKRFLRATRALRRVPWDYEAQETAKREAWPVIRDATQPLEERVAAAERVLRAWYDRSLRNAIFCGSPGDWRRHPCFEAYAAMILYHGDVFPGEVREALVKKYGERPGIPRGSTYWTATCWEV